MTRIALPRCIRIRRVGLGLLPALTPTLALLIAASPVGIAQAEVRSDPFAQVDEPGSKNTGATTGESSTIAAASKTNVVKPFAPGVRIDWTKRRVEVDARVVLREGALELFACTPQTREHESILVVHARPLHIFQALGLIGLEPGAPATYDRDKDTWSPPRGQRLSLGVQYTGEGDTHEVPIERWMRSVKTQKPPPPINWVFAGSRTWTDGRFAADPDGTVVGVVDFDTALISVGELHSADNELLWLEANTSEIPPLGAKCTLLIQAAQTSQQNDERNPPAEKSDAGLAPKELPQNNENLQPRSRDTEDEDPGSNQPEG